MKPRRKRLLIALAAVLALSAGFWWMTCPVIDSRLVGTWEAYDVFPNESFWSLVLEPNGSGRMAFVDGSSSEPFSWTVRNEVFEFGHMFFNSSSGLIDKLVQFLGMPFVSGRRYQIVNADAQEVTLKLRDGGGPEAVTLRRTK